MDYTELYKLNIAKCVSCRYSPNFILRHEILYYDESGNDKHLVVKGDKLNTMPNSVFVLGGIQADDAITIEEFKGLLQRETTAECKSTKDLKGDFTSILRKEVLNKILKIITEKGWHVHFNAIQVLYYGFVDIVDSIGGLGINPIEFKAILYDILKQDPETTIKHFKKYKYPNVKSCDISAFLDGIISLLKRQMESDVSHGLFSPFLFYMISRFEAAKNQRDLPFVQENEPHVWVTNFEQFYREEIWAFARKTLIFDEEKQVMKSLENEGIEIEGKSLTNFSFCDSSTNAMIQICDYVVSVLRKYFIFLDREQCDVDADISAFDEIQIANFKLLNSVLSSSLEYNPVFFNMVFSQHTQVRFYNYISLYGE